jgi:hypothetical protein
MPTIPSFYRLFFPTLDPLIAFSGILTNLLSPSTILTLYNPAAHLPPLPEALTLIDINAGFLFATTPLQIIMLRLRPDDVVVWKCLQGSILLQDLGILAAVGRALVTQGRASVGLVRLEEWGNIVILGAVAVIRAAFLLNVGFADGKGKGKAKRT